MRTIEVESHGLEYTKKINDLLLADGRERIFQEYIISPFLQRIFSDYDIDIVPVDIKVPGKAHDYNKYCGKYGVLKGKKLHQIIETPDLCVAKGWKWINNDDNTKYIATVEIKTPFSNNKFWIAPGYEEKPTDEGENNIIFENNVSEMKDFINEHMLARDKKYPYEKDEDFVHDIKKQIGIHLRGINKVIVTDGIRWLFFYKDENGSCNVLDPIDLGTRICKKLRKNYQHLRIEWDMEEREMKGYRFISGPKNFSKLESQIIEFCQKDVSELKKS